MTISNSGDPLTKEAIDWLMRLEEAPDDIELQAAARAWREANPEHAMAWGKAERAWRWLADPKPDAVEHPPLFPSTPVGHRPQGRWSTGRRWTVAVAGAIAACLMLLYAPSVVTNLRSDFATTTAELRQVTLEDGTTVELAPQTALDVRFTADRRAVALLAGEAFFDVVANPKRPFEVQAAELSVLVTGTAFDVRMRTDSVAVGVKHGSVEAHSRSRGSAFSPVRLGPGDELVFDRRTGAVRRTRVPPDEVGSWREYRMFVERATVAEVVEALQRYHSGWIVLVDRGLAQQQVAGLYDLRDPEQALRILVEPFGGRIHEVTPLLRIISGP
jgi:transmembrane sensor